MLAIFKTWRLQTYGYTLAAGYALFAWSLYHLGVWLLNKQGAPIYFDFTFLYVPGRLSLHGQTATIFSPTTFVKAQEAIVGLGHVIFPNWGYPPIYFLVLAPLATVPYLPAFFLWGAVTLAGYVSAVYAIVRRREAIALALASPFAAWNFIAGQGGALTAALLGAALCNLEHRPAVAGMFIGCLTYKPHWGILIPIALFAGREWRAIVSAVLTTAFLAGLTVALFGIGPWLAFPHALAAQADLTFVARTMPWGLTQSIYGLVRFLNGGAKLASITQGLATAIVVMIVWLTWRSRTRYALKAAVLGAAVLVASPYAYPYDFVAIALPIAFLAKDQIACGVLRGEQVALLIIFVASIADLVLVGRAPAGSLIVLALLALILCRIPRAAAATGPLIG